jgi:hypothetical protein
VAGLDHIGWLVSIIIGGWFASEYAEILNEEIMSFAQFAQERGYFVENEPQPFTMAGIPALNLGEKISAAATARSL